MTELVDMSAEKTKRIKPCCYCGKRENHPEFSCPRIASLELAEDGSVCGVTFVDERADEAS